MNSKKMTIFYIKKDFEIESITGGEQDLRKYADMRLDVVEIVYGYIVLDYDEFIFKNRKLFKIDKDENSVLYPILKEESLESLKKYL